MVYSINQRLRAGMMKIPSLVVLLMLVVFSGPGVAGFCKWVDENGVVHYAETCPDDVDGTEIDTQAPPSLERVEQAVRSSEKLLEQVKTSKENRSAAQPGNNKSRQGQSPKLKTAARMDCTSTQAEKSVKELEALCTQAREKRIGPEREAEIRTCKSERKNDPEWCERYWSNYGDRRKVGRSYQSPKYWWLQECVEARKCRETADQR